MSTWVTSCTSLISRRNFVKCATHLKTVFIPTTQPHPSLTSSTACICHHLWKVEFSSSWRQLFNQQNSWQTTYNIHAVVVQLCLIRKIYNKILALILGLLWCIQWHHFQQSRIVKPARLQWGAPGGTRQMSATYEAPHKPVVFPPRPEISTQHQALVTFCGNWITIFFKRNLWG